MSTTTDSYSTPQGVFSGQPDIAYPNTPGFTPKNYVPVGGVILADEELTYNDNRRTVTIKVRNTGDRPIQIGSHFHFFEVNRYMEFDRQAAFGKHLNIPLQQLSVLSRVKKKRLNSLLLAANAVLSVSTTS